VLSPELFWPARNFGALDDELSSFQTARFVVVPAPYDSTTTWRGGTRDGGNAIIDASMNMELYDHELLREIAEVGIHTTPDLEPDMRGPQHMAARVEQAIGEILDTQKFPVLLGGEHSLTLGGVRALAARSEKVTVVQIDAHADLRDEYCDTKFGHGCVMRRCSEIPNVQIVQIGLRSASRGEIEQKPQNVTQFWADDLFPHFGEAEIAQILEKIEGDVYLTWDVDGCDPSWMPNTGTPEPGGFSYFQLRALFKAICAQKSVKAFDCVELIGGHEASAFACARLIYKIIGYLTL